MNTMLSFFIVFSILLDMSGAIDDEGCQSAQYLEFGSNGTIICSFREGFFSVYWYNSRNYVSEQAVVEYKDSIKRGNGFTDGEFDIYPNGSLIINNVTFSHDHEFTVIKLNSVLDDYDPHYVRVIVTVRPAYPYPIIEYCGTGTTFCFQKTLRGSDLNCFVRDTRPEVTLEWITKIDNSDRNMTFDYSTQASAELISSIATTKDSFAYTQGLSLLACKAEGSPGLLDESESFIIVQNSLVDLSSVKPVPNPVQINSRLELECAESGVSYLVWQYKHTNDDEFQEILYTVVTQNLTVMKDGFHLNRGDSLVIPSILIENEGLYGCIYDNGTLTDMRVYDVRVYVPAYPAVEGCENQQYCLLKVRREGSVTCTVRGIRPKVKLMWKPLHESSSPEISFKNPETTFTRNSDGTFDVSLTSQYETLAAFIAKVTVECKVSETDIEMPQLTKIVDLHFVTETNEPTGGYVVPTNDATVYDTNTSLVIILVIVAVIIVVILVVACLILRAKCFSRRPLEQDTDVLKSPDIHPVNFSFSSKEQMFFGSIHTTYDPEKPMLQLQPSNNPPFENDYKANMKTFVTELKAKYEDMCSSIFPVPYMRDSYSVDQVFVEGGFEYMVSSKRWKQLGLYHEILSDSCGKSKRCIIEGKAGYGKSILTLRFAYDWCHNIPESPLKNTEILILLRLRQLGGVDTIYRAIKRLLLPRDTLLSENDIKVLLQQNPSVVVILDGFDEYPHADKERNSFVINMIKRQIFQQTDVILTTRSGFLSKDLVPQAKYIRLTGFHDDAQEKYLRKVIATDSTKSTEKVKETLQQNPFLEDICRVPLFFVLFAHMCNEEKYAQNFKSVTTFFRHIISCLHSHRKNKLKDDEAKAYHEQYEINHAELDKIAFDGLCLSKQLVWEKNSLVKQLGEEFYQQYTSIGVLVEDVYIDINDDPGVSMLKHIQECTDVTFYHNLICEWYAAHFLAEYAAKLEVKLDPRDTDLEQSNESDKVNLQNLDPADVQYVYRFACGLNLDAADKIYQYLKSRPGGDKFATLCLLEQTGKFEKIKHAIEKLCKSTISIYDTHSRLNQKSTIQHLEIASRHGIPIKNLWINKCFESVNYTWKQIILTSGARIPKLYTLWALDIRHNGKEMTEQETKDVLEYCLWCAELKVVKFVYCLMPLTIPTDSLNGLQRRNVKVVWDTDFTSVFRLNLSSGSWQHEDGGVQMTEDEYKEQVEVFRRLQKGIEDAEAKE